MRTKWWRAARDLASKHLCLRDRWFSSHMCETVTRRPSEKFAGRYDTDDGNAIHRYAGVLDYAPINGGFD